MRTISVKEAAAALGLTERAIIYRLDKGALKGTQSPNAFGKPQWRVYPTKEIAEGLKRLNMEPELELSNDQLNFEPTSDEFPIDVTEAQVYEDTLPGTAETSVDTKEQPGSGDWQELARDTLKGLAEELVKPLGEMIRSQQELINYQREIITEKDLLIEDKERQLKLLPDVEKRAEKERDEAETQRKAAHLATLETEALKKQIEALEKERQEQDEKLLQVSGLEDQVASLSAQMQKLQEPWWKKWFSPRDVDM